MRDQAMGGDLVYIVSKNAFFAGPNNVAYGAAKADQAHQVRLLAAELGGDGIRVNGVNPDGVVRGSGIFAKGWGADRARTYGVAGGQARRVLRAAHDPQEGGPAGARGRGRVRARRRGPVADDRAPHPGRRRGRGRVPAVSTRRRRRGRPRRDERPGHRRAGRRRRAAARRGPPVPQRPGRAARRAALGRARAVRLGARGAATRAASAAAAGGSVASIGIDSWAVDFGLVDERGALLGEPVPLPRRAERASAWSGSTPSSPADALYRRTGIQHLPFNTVFQLAAARDDPAFAAAHAMLLIPDLLGAWLTGERAAERTNASTTALLDPATGDWALGPRRRARPAARTVPADPAAGRAARVAAAGGRGRDRPGRGDAGHARRLARHGLGGRRRPGRGRRRRLDLVRDLGPRRRRARRPDPDRGQPRRRTSRTRPASTARSATFAT